MGRIRPTYIKRVSIELLNKYPQAFSKDFEANKEMVSTLTDVSSVKMRNRIHKRLNSFHFRSNRPRGVAWISCEIADLLTRVRIPARAPYFSRPASAMAEAVINRERRGLSPPFRTGLGFQRVFLARSPMPPRTIRTAPAMPIQSPYEALTVAVASPSYPPL